MPSVSGKQHRLMAAVAHNPAFAKRVGIPVSVGKEFTQADKGHKFSKGGDMKSDSAAYKAKERRHVAAMQKAGIKGKVLREEKAEAGMKKGGFVRSADGVVKKGHTKAKHVAMKKGGRC